MIPDAGTQLPAAAVAALVVGFLRTSVGGGIGLVLTPTLSLVLPAPVVLALIAPLMNLSDPLTLRYYWGRWEGRQLRLLLPTSLAGVVLGAWLLSVLPEPALVRLIGAVALVFGVTQLALGGRQPRWIRALAHPAAGVAVGLLVGLASMIAHSAGIVMNLYLLSLKLPPPVILGTGSMVYVFTNVVKLGGYWQVGFLSGSILLAAVLSVPVLALGAWLGARVNRRLPRRAFELTLVAIALAGALRLLTR